ncbi:hypothetical protein, partial [Paracoccus sp. APAP_BH8]|uniref:hypothetical protein n=1 Tax=Paracoccus sp. APAP_BH8 TaxID=3110237 RepID=UPI003FA7E954
MHLSAGVAIFLAQDLVLELLYPGVALGLGAAWAIRFTWCGWSPKRGASSSAPNRRWRPLARHDAIDQPQRGECLRRIMGTRKDHLESLLPRQDLRQPLHAAGK